MTTTACLSPWRCGVSTHRAGTLAATACARWNPKGVPAVVVRASPPPVARASPERVDASYLVARALRAVPSLHSQSAVGVATLCRQLRSVLAAMEVEAAAREGRAPWKKGATHPTGGYQDVEVRRVRSRGVMEPEHVVLAFLDDQGYPHRGDGPALARYGLSRSGVIDARYCVHGDRPGDGPQEVVPAEHSYQEDEVRFHDLATVSSGDASTRHEHSLERFADLVGEGCSRGEAVGWMEVERRIARRGLGQWEGAPAGRWQRCRDLVESARAGGASPVSVQARLDGAGDLKALEHASLAAVVTARAPASWVAR